MIDSILFPRTCVVCGSVLPGGVKHLCTRCIANLPLTGQFSRPGNSMEQLFGYLPGMERAGGWIYYRPGSDASRLIEAIKYNGTSRLARHLGELIGKEAAAAGLTEGIDGIQPVPLHFLRKLKRGYNQSEMLARGISKVCGAPVLDMVATRRHRTQTALPASQRRENVKGIYRMKKVTLPPWQRQSPRLLLVDDVCTTGSTLSALAEVIERAYPGARFLFLTLAVTDR